jgi:hypothetical protein
MVEILGITTFILQSEKLNNSSVVYLKYLDLVYSELYSFVEDRCFKTVLRI